MQVWLPGLLAPLLCAACSFDSPEGGPGDDGGSNVPPPCADGDDDGDTVCNAVDKCPGKADGGDADNDGTVDGCDDWPCAVAKPEDPGEIMADDADGNTRGWGAGGINIGNMRRVVAARGQPFDVAFRWGIYIDCGSGPDCPAQIEIGYDLTRTGCIFDGTVPNKTILTGRSYAGQLTAPTMPGEYEIRLNAGRAASCNSGVAWYNGDPGSDSTIAILCVP